VVDDGVEAQDSAKCVFENKKTSICEWYVDTTTPFPQTCRNLMVVLRLRLTPQSKVAPSARNPMRCYALVVWSPSSQTKIRFQVERCLRDVGSWKTADSQHQDQYSTVDARRRKPSLRHAHR